MPVMLFISFVVFFMLKVFKRSTYQNYIKFKLRKTSILINKYSILTKNANFKSLNVKIAYL
ncbi:hypothetical protein GCM10023315_15320 [Algibacter aquimarinus]|uniref:Uncharacterized protein n=1 Tax=Algibacter aquimarinus TaxID=1136748 RepID=A0ABP9HBR8_9FLAO